MNKILLLGGLLLSVLGTVGCACYGPGYGSFGDPCGSAITPYRYGGIGVDYVDGGPGAGNTDCGGHFSRGYCGPGHLVGGDCGRCIANGLRVIGEGAVGLVAAPFVLVGSLINCGAYGNYYGSGCSNEAYYGDNCYQPHDFCDPCGGTAIGHAPSSAGCSQCSGGYSEGVQPGEPVTMSPKPPVRRPQQSLAQSMFRPVQFQRPLMAR